MSASIAWIASDDLDLVGRMHADSPFLTTGSMSLFLTLDAVTAIERTLGDVTFVVRDLAYTLEAGARWRAPAGHGLSVFVGTQGIERADAEGAAWIRYVAAAAESPRFRAPWPGGAPGYPPRSLGWRAALGAVVDVHDIEASWLASGELRARLCGNVHPGLRGDLSVSTLRVGDRSRTDLAVGPRLDVDRLSNGRISLFAHYVRSRHPFGLRVSAVLVGIEAEDLHARGAWNLEDGSILGRAALGAGDSRGAARFKILFLSPRWRESWRAAVDVDANVLTAEETGELYYLYHLGAEREQGRRVVGAYFFHRSNHRLAEPGGTVTSLNVLETGIETTGWDYRNPEERLARGAHWEGRFRLGYIAASAFGERERWHLRAGGRLSYGTGRRFSPLVEVEVEEGEAARRLYALGVAAAPGTDLRLEYRSDEQFYGRDRTALLLLGTYVF